MRICLVVKILMLLMMTVFYSCSGYHFKDQRGPLAKYDIYSLKIPIFLNKSVIPSLSGAFTKYFTLVLGQFKDLKIEQTGTTDAILIGIIRSPLSLRKAIFPSNERIIINDLNAKPWRNFYSLGQRRKFWIPDNMKMAVQLQLVLIKDPSNQDLEMLINDEGGYEFKGPKIIFNKYMDLEKIYINEIYDLSIHGPTDGKTHPDARGVLNFTQSMGNKDNAIKQMAQEAANSFKESILFAF